MRQIWHEAVRSVVSAFTHAPVPVQWLCLSIAKSFVASALMSFVANYATIYFSINNGFRAPFEGVPYLHLGIALATFAAFLGTLIMFGVLIATIKYIEYFIADMRDKLNFYIDAPIAAIEDIHKIANKTEAHKHFAPAHRILKILRDLSTKLKDLALRSSLEKVEKSCKSVFSSEYIIAASAAIYVLNIYLFIFPPAELTSQINLIFSSIQTQTSKIAITDVNIFLMVISCLMAASWSIAREVGWIVSQIISSVFIFITFSVALFVPDVYGSFLRIMRVGGGIEFSVQALESKEGKPIVRHGNMLIQTASHLIFIDKGDSQVHEIPIANVVGISYGIHPEWMLPGSEITNQRTYIRVENIK